MNWFAMVRREPRPVLKVVTGKIQAGDVLKTYKTRPRVGRKSVTVGPYQTATGRQMYALTVGGDLFTYDTAHEAASSFIEEVGHNDAWEAAHGGGRDRNPK